MQTATNKIFVSLHLCLSPSATPSVLRMLRRVLPEMWQLCQLVTVWVYLHVLWCYSSFALGFTIAFLPGPFFLAKLWGFFWGDLPVSCNSKHLEHLPQGLPVLRRCVSNVARSFYTYFIVTFALYNYVWGEWKWRTRIKVSCSGRLRRVRAKYFTFLNVVAPFAFASLGKQDQVLLRWGMERNIRLLLLISMCLSPLQHIWEM